MTKRKTRKTRKTRRRSQRGGEFWNPFSWFKKSEPDVSYGNSGVVNGAENVASSVVSGVSSLATGVQDAASSAFSSLTPNSGSSGYAPASSPSNYAPTSYGGRRRRKSRKMRGGKGDLGLVYYATPVSGLKVAEPTYWIKGGSKRRRRKHRS